jgi:protocatechuate 3,4-dioxygenase beta subunit
VRHKLINLSREKAGLGARKAQNLTMFVADGARPVQEGDVKPLLKSWRAGVGLAVCFSLFRTASGAQTPAGASGVAKAGKEKDETCRVSGMVVKMVDGTPLKNATVQLTNDQDQEHTIATKTTADGKFELRNIPAGRYKLVANRNGYVEAEYGQTKPSDSGAAFSLSPGENNHDLLFKLIPAAVIAGRVFDEDGEPLPNAQVMASRETYYQGHRTVATRAMADTDDLGQFRLHGLAPGRYYVSASDSQWRRVTGEREFIAGAAQGTERGYTKTYYPGTTDPDKAAVISVKEGEEVPGTDIVLKQVAVYRIRGRVFNQITQKGGMGVVVMLTPRSKRLEWDMGRQNCAAKADGTFEVPDVVPGLYTLTAYWSDDGKTHTTRENIEIGENDLQGVSLILGAGTTIPGYIRWEGQPSLEEEEFSVYLQPIGTWFGGWGASARVEATEHFTLKEVSNGEYRVAVGGFTKDCYIKDTAYGDTHSADGVISVARGAGAALEVTISSRGARVQGAVVDKDGLPAAGVSVVAVPDEARRTNFRLFKEQTTDQYGKFDLHGLAPGSYKLFAWAGVERGEWEDENFLKPFEATGESVELQDGDLKTVNLKLLEKKMERVE